MSLDSLSNPVQFVVNKLLECRAPNQRRVNPDTLQFLVVHRISFAKKTADNPMPIPNDSLDAVSLALRFRTPALGTGGATPYTMLLKTNGICEQLFPLYTAGAHARKYNPVSIALAVVYSPGGQLTEAQKSALPYLFWSLVPLVRGGLICIGHTDLEGASADANKVCPEFSWKEFEYAGRAMLPDDWREWTLAQREGWVAARGFVLQRSGSTLPIS